MDATSLAIAGIGSAVFVGVLVWKGLWFLRRINEDPPPGEEGEDA